MSTSAKFKKGDKVVQIAKSFSKEFNVEGVHEVDRCYTSGNLKLRGIGLTLDADRFELYVEPVDTMNTALFPQHLGGVSNFLADCEEADAKAVSTLGAKYDAGKLKMSLLFNGLALPLRSIAAVLSYGAQKYAADSWQNVPDAYKRYEDALYRHQNLRAAGEIYDEESGLPHRAHELCNQLFLLWFDIKFGTVTNIDKFNKYKS